MMCSSAATTRRSPGHRALAGEQREDAPMHLEVAAVEAVVVGDHQGGKLDVLVGECLEGAIELVEHDVDPRPSRGARGRAGPHGSGGAGRLGAVSVFIAAPVAIGGSPYDGVVAVGHLVDRRHPSVRHEGS